MTLSRIERSDIDAVFNMAIKAVGSVHQVDETGRKILKARQARLRRLRDKLLREYEL